jgi:hypothetical protein
MHKRARCASSQLTVQRISGHTIDHGLTVVQPQSTGPFVCLRVTKHNTLPSSIIPRGRCSRCMHNHRDQLKWPTTGVANNSGITVL